MRKLIVVRHGEYYDGHLDESGQKQIGRLGRALSDLIGKESILILSSTATRAKESAEVLADIFGVTFEEHPILWSDNDHRENLDGTLELVLSKKTEANVIILVTHLEYTQGFPAYFGEKELGARFSYRSLAKGEAWVIDCEAKTIIHIR